MKNIATSASLFVLTLSVAFTGCLGSGKEPMEYVQGVVTMNNAPVEGATVTFTPKSANGGTVAAGKTDATGTYKLNSATGKSGAGTKPGDYIVTIKKLEKYKLDKPTVDSYGNPITEGLRNSLPEKYAGGKSTPLTATVVSGKNTCDFKLE